MVSKSFHTKPLEICTNNGGEYVGREIKNYLAEQGIVHQLMVPNTPEQNGAAERKSHYLTETCSHINLEAELPDNFWGKALTLPSTS